jgi:membrane protease YdiL (CAAX protease family)
MKPPVDDEPEEPEELDGAVIPTDSEPATEDEAALPSWLGPLDRLLPPIVTVAAAVVLYLALAAPPGSGSVFLGIGGLYVVTGAVVLLRLRARGELWILRPRGGDLTFGGLVTLLLYGMAYVFHSLVTSSGQARFEWILQIYLRLGDPFSDDRHWVGLAAAAVGALEELTWRGGVHAALEQRLGWLRGNVVGVVLYAAAHVGTLWALAGSQGLNPLLLLASLGCGVAWTYLRLRSDQQLVPVIWSHALFTWSLIEFPLFVKG